MQELPIRVSMIITSHLSDAQHEVNIPTTHDLIQRANNRMNFVKWLVHKYPDMNTEISPKKAYGEFLDKFPKLPISTSKVLWVFALCSATGTFEEFIKLHPSEIIVKSNEANEDGVRYMKYVDGMGQQCNAYFLEYTEINF